MGQGLSGFPHTNLPLPLVHAKQHTALFAQRHYRFFSKSPWQEQALHTSNDVHCTSLPPMPAFKIGGAKALRDALAARGPAAPASPPPTVANEASATADIYAGSPLSLVALDLVDLSTLPPAQPIEDVLRELQPGLSLHSAPGRGRFLVATRAFAAGEVILRERAFAGLDYTVSRGDDRAIVGALRADIPRDDVLARFLQLEPTRSRIEASSSSSPLPLLSIIAPPVHWNGFQTHVGAGRARIPIQLCTTACSMFNHTCEPNVAYEAADDDGPVVEGPADDGMPRPSPSSRPRRPLPVVTFSATRPIAVGEEVTFSYVDAAADVVDRRLRLREGYGFDCDCRRCEREMAEAGSREEAYARLCTE